MVLHLLIQIVAGLAMAFALWQFSVMYFLLFIVIAAPESRVRVQPDGTPTGPMFSAQLIMLWLALFVLGALAFWPPREVAIEVLCGAGLIGSTLLFARFGHEGMRRLFPSGLGRISRRRSVARVVVPSIAVFATVLFPGRIATAVFAAAVGLCLLDFAQMLYVSRRHQ